MKVLADVMCPVASDGGVLVSCVYVHMIYGFWRPVLCVACFLWLAPLGVYTPISGYELVVPLLS